VEKMWQEIIVDAASLLIALVALAAAAWDIGTGQIGEQGIDGLFLLVVCFVFIVMFGGMGLHSLRHGPLGQMLKRKPPQPPAPEEVKGEPVGAQKSQDKS
jgi:hypothetical protein